MDGEGMFFQVQDQHGQPYFVHMRKKEEEEEKGGDDDDVQLTLTACNMRGRSCTCAITKRELLEQEGFSEAGMLVNANNKPLYSAEEHIRHIVLALRGEEGYKASLETTEATGGDLVAVQSGRVASGGLRALVDSVGDADANGNTATLHMTHHLSEEEDDDVVVTWEMKGHKDADISMDIGALFAEILVARVLKLEADFTGAQKIKKELGEAYLKLSNQKNNQSATFVLTQNNTDSKASGGGSFVPDFSEATLASLESQSQSQSQSQSLEMFSVKRKGSANGGNPKKKKKKRGQKGVGWN
jgi:hypothetical protein